MLEVENLRVEKEGDAILRDLNFRAGRSELHVVMGPNGSGKSTMAKTLAGHPDYRDYDGKIRVKGKEISELDPDERLKLGLMLGFQHPPKIEGVKVGEFFARVLENSRGFQNEEKAKETINSSAKSVGFSDDLLERNVNAGFSGGERKRLELLQAELIDPAILVLDEPDSGVDVDSLDLIAGQINRLRARGATIVLITHYGNLLEDIDREKLKVHLFKNGAIPKSGGEELVREVEEKGFIRIFEECGCN